VLQTRTVELAGNHAALPPKADIPAGPNNGR
jgi:hypothetical protein